MRRIEENLYNKKTTAHMMYFLIENFYRDLETYFIKRNGQLIPVTELKLREFFDIVRRIPYRRDNKPVEIISRPSFILKHQRLGMDCKKKGILMSSFLKYKKYPYRLMSSSKRPDGKIHHVFPQVFINQDWQNLDATYNNYKPFDRKKVTNWEVLK